METEKKQEVVIYGILWLVVFALVPVVIIIIIIIIIILKMIEIIHIQYFGLIKY